MYADKSITLGQVNSDEAIQNSKSQPTLAVMAPLEISPLMILWGTKAHPNFNTIADIGQTDTKILYYQTDAYVQYLLGAGLVRASQMDGSYDGTPTRFVTSGGDDRERRLRHLGAVHLQERAPQGADRVRHATCS